MTYEKYEIGTVRNTFLNEWIDRDYTFTEKEGKDVLVKSETTTYTRTVTRKRVVVNVPDKLRGFQELEGVRLKPATEEALFRVITAGGAGAESKLRELLREENKSGLEASLRGLASRISEVGVSPSKVFPEKEVEEEEKVKRRRVVDEVPVIEVSYSVLVVGEYKGTDEIGIDGDKEIITGIKAPEEVPPGVFWSNLFDRIRESIIEKPPLPDGEWFSQLMTTKYFGEESKSGRARFLRNPKFTWDISKSEEGILELDEDGTELMRNIERKAENRDLK